MGALRAAEAFVLPSHQENFGVAVVEALACKVPVLISDKVNIWPEIQEDAAGIVNADTTEGTFRSMAALLAMSAEERGRMVRNGLACFRARYEMRRTAEALDEVFWVMGSAVPTGLLRWVPVPRTASWARFRRPFGTKVGLVCRAECARLFVDVGLVQGGAG